MTTTTKVYVAQLARLYVFDPNGDRVGRVRDVVVALRLGATPPRVLGMLVEIAGRRRIFVPIGRVTGIDSSAVRLGTGMLNLRRFEQRAGETLVLGELLDRSVILDDNKARGIVVDAAMEMTRGAEWLLTRLAIQETGRLGRRRGRVR